MKMKHNKKRNTLFLYETLLRELTKCVVRKDNERRIKVLNIIKESFVPSTLLGKDLSLYRNLAETKEMRRDVAEKLVFETRMEKAAIDDDALFGEHSRLINKINATLSPDVFNNFVPDFKNIATISQIFNPHTPVKSRVLLEATILETMIGKQELTENKKMKPISSLAYKTFVSKFNKKYGDDLLTEQKKLLGIYVASFQDDTELKIFLNEEVGRLKEELINSLDNEEFQADVEMKNTAELVIEKLNSYAKSQITPAMVKTILKTQELVKELNN